MYLELISNPKHQITISNLPTSSHSLEIGRGRYAWRVTSPQEDNDRTCLRILAGRAGSLYPGDVIIGRWSCAKPGSCLSFFRVFLTVCGQWRDLFWTWWTFGIWGTRTWLMESKEITVVSLGSCENYTESMSVTLRWWWGTNFTMLECNMITYNVRLPNFVSTLISSLANNGPVWRHRCRKAMLDQTSRQQGSFPNFCWLQW